MLAPLWEGFVVGRPFSANSTNKRTKARWQGLVSAMATSTAPLVPLQQEVRFLMLVLDQEQVGDVDNKLKYTLDALVGPVLVDDKDVKQVTGAAVDISQQLDVMNPSPMFAAVLEHLLTGGQLPIVYLQIATAKLTKELLDA